MRTTGVHGADISSQRLDDLDVAALSYALSPGGVRTNAVDLGCGLGMQGLRFAALGWNTLLIDIAPIEFTVLRYPGVVDLLPIGYLQRDARALLPEDLPSGFRLCYSQRFLHYLRFEEARSLLSLLASRMAGGGKAFLSASGLQSELGSGYRDGLDPVARRFSLLAPAMAEKHDIREPVCLYTEADLELLGREAGFDVERVFASPFGNIKGVFHVG